MKKIIITEDQAERLISEQISAIRRDEKQEIFNYDSITSDAWNEIVQLAKETQKIGFDLENNDTTGQKKTLYVKKNLRKDQPIKYEFNVELMKAGGDWEMPVMYFRVEFTHEYFYGDLKRKDKKEYTWNLDRKFGGLYKCHVVIPPVEAGNKLKKHQSDSQDGKYEWYAYDNGELSKEEEKEARITDADEKSAWEWIQKLLEDLVEENHKMLDEPDRPEPSDVAPDRAEPKDEKSS